MQIELIEEHFRPKNRGWRSDALETGKIHLSDIAKYIDYKMGFSKPIKAVDWDLVLAAEIGFLWEDVLSDAYGVNYATRVGEIERDGIVCSPDGVGIFEESVTFSLAVNEEYKATWKSLKNPPEDNWYWMCQFKSYCYVIGVNVTILRVLYINGDYRGSGPTYRVFKITYTDQELEENWQMIVNHRDEMISKGFLNIKMAKGEV